ncbi:(4Fe-4S)-binding protein [Spirochaetia bacterium]|nr:(4Fe-4S)-binding protein [Spirochaetia bacterium]
MEKNEILVVYGADPAEMAYKIAEEAGLAELIGDKKKRIGLKPNLVVARPAAEGATTHPEIAGGLIDYLQKNGFDNIVILEGSWVGDNTRDAFRCCGYADLARRKKVELIDTQQDKAKAYDCKGMKIEICDSARAVDFMINLPVMKGHCQTLVTCALKNNKGIMPDREKRRFHSLGLHKPIAHLNTVARNDFIVVDGICGDLDFEEGGNPVFAGRLFAARDPVLCDAWVAEQMGYAASEIPYIGLAEKLGVGVGDPKKAAVRELNRPGTLAQSGGRPGGKVRQLTQYIEETEACSACYAALIFALSRMDHRELGRLPDKIAIGQGFRGKKGILGVGRCTQGFAAAIDTPGASCPGCPPSGAEVLGFLRQQ